MREFKHGSVELVVGNIVNQDTDAIVNAANTKLLGGGGVDGAIHRAAGPELKQWCAELPADENGGRCQTGDVKTTPAGRLNAKYVIHGVGPVYTDGDKKQAHDQLRQVHRRALEAAAEHGCKSVAFPAISTGAYRFPIDEAAEVAIDVACSYLETQTGIELIRFVLFDQEQCDQFAAALDRWTPAG